MNTKGWSAPRSFAAFVGGVVAATLTVYVTAEAKIDSKVDRAAESAVAKKWDEKYEAAMLRACTAAADQGAYRAVSEAMQQTVLPLQRTIDAHVAAQAEHERQDEKRFTRIEKRLGMSP